MIEPRVADRPHAFPFSPSGADIAFACTKHVQFVLEGARRLTPHRSAAPGTAQHEAFGVCWHRGIAPTEIPAVWVDGDAGRAHRAGPRGDRSSRSTGAGRGSPGAACRSSACSARRGAACSATPTWSRSTSPSPSSI